jgi:hypothetical protein
LISRIYRDDVSRNAVDAFRVNVIHARQQVGNFGYFSEVFESVTLFYGNFLIFRTRDMLFTDSLELFKLLFRTFIPSYTYSHQYLSNPDSISRYDRL